VKFTIQQKALEEALAVTILATEAKSPHDMYSRLLIDARPDGEVHFSATNTILAIHTVARAESVETPGKWAVSAVKIRELTANMPPGVVKLEHTPKDSRILFSAAKRKYTLGALPGADYPVIEAPPKAAKRFTLPHKALLGLLKRVGFAIGDDRSRPGWMGVELLGTAASITAVAARGAMLATASIKAEAGGVRMFVPAPAIPALRMLGGADVALVATDHWIFAESGKTVVAAALPQAPFVPWEEVLRNAPRGLQCRVDADTLARSVAAVYAARSAEDDIGVRLELANGEIRVSLSGKDSTGEDVVPVDGNGFFVIRLNARLVCEILNSAGGIVRLDHGGPSDPLLFDSDEGFLSMISPIVMDG